MDHPEKKRVPRIEPLRDADFGYGVLPWANGPKWRLAEDYTFTLAIDLFPRRDFQIPAGYIFDKASVPPLFWGFPLYYTPDGLCMVPALEHDFLCDLLSGGSWWLRETMKTLPESPLPWEVHQHFFTRLMEWEVEPRKARAMGLAVKAFGPKGWARPSSIWAKLTEPIL